MEDDAGEDDADPAGETGAVGTVPANVAPAQPSEAAALAPEKLTLNYSLTVQRMRGGREYKEPFESTGREIFEGGWRFRINLSTPKPGYLYLINEGRKASGALGYTVLYLTAGDARLDARPARAAPQRKGLLLHSRASRARRRFGSSGRSSPSRRWRRSSSSLIKTDQGEVKDATQVANLREFFAAHASPPAEVIEDKANKQTTVRAAGTMLVHLAELEHH